VRTLRTTLDGAAAADKAQLARLASVRADVDRLLPAAALTDL
jgi:hypothetical protein